MVALGRWLYLEGEETETAWCPEWYPIVQAAKYLNTTPWTLLEQSVYWRDVALKSMAGEYRAQKIQEQHPKS